MSPTRLLRSARLAAHLSQAEVARAVGVSVKTVQRWEAGEPASRRHAEALEAFVEQIEIHVAGRPLEPAAPEVRLEARRTHDQVMALMRRMVASGERVPPGWRWDMYSLMSLLRRASLADGLVFAEEVDSMLAEAVMVAEWRKAALGADSYGEFRGRVVSVLQRIRASSPARKYLNGSALFMLAGLVGHLWPGSPF